MRTLWTSPAPIQFDSFRHPPTVGATHQTHVTAASATRREARSGRLRLVEVPIDGTLDLHTFLPREVKELVPEYLAECRRRGILEVRIIHGKGIGSLRRQVHAIVGRLPEVDSFRLAGESAGGWGATLVTLRPAERP